jgi:uncharacterized membrane protein (UPF0127 family)
MTTRRFLLTAACAFAVQAAAAVTTRAQQEKQITGPQPTLPTQKLTIVTKDGVRHDFTVEMATTPDQQEIGLMFRPTVGPDSGMLFVWDYPRASQMWMKNTIAPLDMVFINPDGTIRSIIEDTVPESLAILDSHGPVKATLELAAGTTARLGIVVGDRVEGSAFGKAG